MYSGSLRQTVVEEFTEITKNAFREFVNLRIANRLKTALDSEVPQAKNEVITQNEEIENEIDDTDNDGIETTQEELDGYYIIKAILRKDVDASRVVLRDVKSYCGILLDDNNRKPICRLRFNRSQKYLGLMDKDKNEERVAIEKMDDIYDYAEKLREIVAYYDSDE